MACGKLTKSLIAAACGKAPASGTDASVYLVNFEDVDKQKTVVTANGVITTLALNEDANLYRLISKPKATSGTSTFSRGTYFDAFDHAVTLRAFAKNQATKDFMNQMIGARVMVIVENIDDGAYTIAADGTWSQSADVTATKYELYGYDSGLTLSEMPFATELTDSVAYAATFASDDASKEGQLPLSVYIGGSVAATKTALDGMVAE